MLRFAFLALIASLAFGGSASAQYYRDDSAAYDYADVLAVEPIVEYADAPMYREECWDEPVTYREPPHYARQRRGSEAAAVLGGIVGGVIGHQFGHGYDRHLATSAGAALGYAVVRDAQRDGVYVSGGREIVRYERRCAQRPVEYRQEQRITGFDVTYRYHGRVYRTVTDYDPGPRLRVRVDVSAAP